MALKDKMWSYHINNYNDKKEDIIKVISLDDLECSVLELEKLYKNLLFTDKEVYDSHGECDEMRLEHNTNINHFLNNIQEIFGDFNNNCK